MKVFVTCCYPGTVIHLSLFQPFHMPVTIPPEKIKEIAGYLDAGMNCFYHIKTGEIEYYPENMNDEEIWQEVIDKVEEYYDEYVSFTGFESHESFEMMEDFISTITNKTIRVKFEDIIQRRKPFQQFKNLLLDYPDLRQQWFLYKDERFIENVKEQLDAFNNTYPN